MPFNVGGFNKVLSRAGVQTMGAAPRINQKLETSAAAQGIRNAAKIRAAEYGAQMMADRASAERSAARSNAIFGSIGNVLGSGLSAGLTHGFNFGSGVDGFSASDAQVMGMPSGQADVISRGGFTYWDTDMPTNSWVNMGSGGRNSNPFSRGW
tara:strand:- start:2506 stop:2964 length:459 start_codon:yes stop_codon:yes gene_type:complete